VGNKSFTVLESSYRFLFAILIIVCAFIFQWKLHGTQIHFWHLEQKMTMGLMILAVVMNNPFYYFLVSRAFAFLLILDSVGQSIFAIFVKFYILVIFDSLRFKNRKISDCFFAPKVAFFLVFLIFHTEQEVLRSVIEQTTLSKFSAFEAVIAGVRIIFEIAFVCWLGFAVMRSWRDSDVTEAHKFVLYLSVCGVMLSVHALLECLGHILTFFQRSCAAFVIRISIDNFFVLLMTLFHWPYEVIADQYIAPGEVGLDVGDLYESN
jgi:hypothetical protein